MKFKTLQEEILYWKYLTQEQREAIIEKEREKLMKRKIKSHLKKIEIYLKSGKRTY